MKYKIMVSFTVESHVIVEADDRDTAMHVAEAGELPPADTWVFVPGSFEAHQHDIGDVATD